MAPPLNIPARSAGGPDPVADTAALRAVATQRAADLGLTAPALPTHKPLTDDLRALVEAANAQAAAIGVQGTGLAPADVAGSASPASIVNALVTTYGRIETALTPVVEPDPDPVATAARVRTVMPPVQQADGSGRTVVVPLPEYQPGDRWVLVPQTSGVWQAARPAGWQTAGERRVDATWKSGAVAYYLDPDGTEGSSLTLSLTLTGATEAPSPIAVHVLVLTGVDQDAVPVAVPTFSDGGGTTLTHGGLDAPADGALLLQVLTSSQGGTATWTHATGFTEAATSSRLEAGNNDVQLSTAVRYDVPAGPTGPLDASVTTSSRWTNLVIAFAAGVVAAPPTTAPTPPPSVQAPALVGPVETSSITATSFTDVFTLTVPARRTTDFRRLGSSTWDTSTYVSPSQTQHSASTDDLLPGVEYEVRYRLMGDNGTETTIGPFRRRTLAAPAPSASALPPIDRSEYPSDWQTWPVIYWVNSGSTFRAPNGERVVRSRFLGLGNTEKARIRCPETFHNVVKLGINAGQYYVLEGGVHIKWDRFLGRTDHPDATYVDSPFGRVPLVAATADDARARRNLFPLRPGRTYLDVAGRVTPNDENRGIMINGSQDGVNRPGFRAIEGMYIEGDWAFEGCNYASVDSAGLRLYHFRQDRVSVCYTQNSSGGLTGKSGGDAFQCWNNKGELLLQDFTAAASSIQGCFLQTGMGRQRFIRGNIRGADPTRYGASIYLWWNSPASSNITHRDWYIESSGGRSRDLTIWPKGAFLPKSSSTGDQGINFEPHADWVTREAWLKHYRPGLALAA